MTRKTLIAPLIILALAAVHCTATTRTAKAAAVQDCRILNFASAACTVNQVF